MKSFGANEVAIFQLHLNILKTIQTELKIQRKKKAYGLDQLTPSFCVAWLC